MRQWRSFAVTIVRKRAGENIYYGINGKLGRKKNEEYKYRSMRIANENRTGNVSENGNGERKSLNVDACVCIWIYACGLYIGRVIILIFVYCLLTLCLRHSSCGYWHGINNHMRTEPRPTNRPYAIYSTLYSRYNVCVHKHIQTIPVQRATNSKCLPTHTDTGPKTDFVCADSYFIFSVHGHYSAMLVMPVFLCFLFSFRRSPDCFAGYYSGKFVYISDRMSVRVCVCV